MIATVISCEARRESRERTVAQLKKCGLPVAAFLSPCNPAGPVQNSAVSAKAFRHAAGNPFLFCEDDIELRDDFMDFLAAAVALEEVVYFYAHDNSPRIMEQRYGRDVAHTILNGGKMQRVITRFRDAMNLSNGQCIWLPAWIHEWVDPNAFDGRAVPIDVLLWHTFHKHDYKPLVALPHPVQHLQCRVARTTGPRPGKRSLSFPLQAEGRVIVDGSNGNHRATAPSAGKRPRR